jgi:1-acyl-sn-glycerol-3-phosphate acyltransferase
MTRYGQWLETLQWSTTGLRTAAAKQVVRRVLSPLVHLAFRPSLDGLNHLPQDRPFLLVANHSAGVALAELGSLSVLWTTHVDDRIPIAGFAHPVGFRFAPGRWLHRHVGSVPSTKQAALDALADGVSLLVFPGGDYECLRPFWQSNTVDFGGRVGFLRIARETGVPIVPLGIRGSHWTVPFMFGRSGWLSQVLVIPRLLGVKRWGFTAFGLLGAAALSQLPVHPLARIVIVWAWLGSPFIFLPVVPMTLRFRVGAPLSPDALFGTDGNRPLADALADVEAAIQRLVRRE